MLSHTNSKAKLKREALSLCLVFNSSSSSQVLRHTVPGAQSLRAKGCLTTLILHFGTANRPVPAVLRGHTGSYTISMSDMYASARP